MAPERCGGRDAAKPNNQTTKYGSSSFTTQRVFMHPFLHQYNAPIIGLTKSGSPFPPHTYARKPKNQVHFENAVDALLRCVRVALGKK